MIIRTARRRQFEQKEENFYGLLNRHKTRWSTLCHFRNAKPTKKTKCLKRNKKNSLFDIRKLLKRPSQGEREDKKNVHWKESEKTTRRIFQFKIFIRRFFAARSPIEARKRHSEETKKWHDQRLVKRERAMTRCWLPLVLVLAISELGSLTLSIRFSVFTFYGVLGQLANDHWLLSPSSRGAITWKLFPSILDTYTSTTASMTLRQINYRKFPWHCREKLD